MPGRPMERRDFLRSGIVTVGAFMLGPGMVRQVLAQPAQTEEGPYGQLLAPDDNGIMLPEGFRSRIIARSGELVEGTLYPWHDFPDGGATFPASDGGWVYVSNSETQVAGGASAIRFDADARIVAAYPILVGTRVNCAGGPTPWGTWLSCEEHPLGMTWECDPFGALPLGEPRPAMGTFQHEAAAVDPVRGHVYQTEDEADGLFYRFTPDRPGDLSSGVLEAAEIRNLEAVLDGFGNSEVVWHEVPDPSRWTRFQVPQATVFRGGEGTWFDDDLVYFTTKRDDRVWAYHCGNEALELVYDKTLTPDPILHGVDNIHVAAHSGDVFVAEDPGDLEIVMITPDRTMAPLLRVTGPEHAGSELAGPAFDPAGERFYFSSQRGAGLGITYEVTGPFRRTRI